jgi:arylsulfatase
VPAVARWPGQIPPGTESDHVWAFWDLMPTAAELAGVDPPAACDGISIVPSLLGHDDRQPRHEYLYWEFYERGFQQAVRTGPWKALRLKWGQAIELYNIVDDPAEQHNLAADHPDVVTRCQRIMREAHEPSDHWPSPADR